MLLEQALTDDDDQADLISMGCIINELYALQILINGTKTIKTPNQKK